MLRFKRLTKNAVAPTRGSDDAIGYDLYASDSKIAPACGKAIISTDLSFEIPQGHYGRIAPRSSMAWKKHTDVGAGVIDRDYTGAVGIVIFNHSQDDLVVNAGDRIAQLILEKASIFPLEEVTSIHETNRGGGGFGSTGV